jgi:hypothetical protein
MSLHDRPSPLELLEAVREYLSEEVAATPDRRARFRALIAANVLAIAAREIASAPEDERAEEALFVELGIREGTLDERRALLAARIRAGACDEPAEWSRVTGYARETVLRKLAVANPKFAARVSRPA